jgi:flavodoxin
MKLKKMIWIVAGIAGLAVGIQISSVIGIEYYQLRKNAKLLDSFKINRQNSKTLVVYFSRSGNTELMAYKIAEIKNGNLLNIEANDYKIGFKGWVNAMLDARKVKATISNEKVDLSAYDTIYVGSPIWLYSPAPPVFEFVDRNDFTEKKVILFNSMNSKFDQRYIDEISALVGKNGGQMIRHVYVIRGRMTQQMDVDEFLSNVRVKLGPK